MRIQHNIAAMGSYRSYKNNVSSMKKNLEKLASGYRVNRAGDDAAGLAISEKMRAQITGLDTAQGNAADGISLVQTAEGALTEVHAMLNRMAELATQSANGTYDNETDRAQLQKELEQLLREIDRIADSSNFNGINLLDGSMDGSTVIGTSYVAVGAGEIEGLLPLVGDPVQSTVESQGTVLEDEGIPASQAGFEIDLENLTVDAAEPGVFTLTIAGEQLTGNLEEAGTYTGADLAQAILETSGGVFTDADGNEFTIEAQDGKLIFQSDGRVELKTTGTVTARFTEGSSTPEVNDAHPHDLAISTDLTISAINWTPAAKFIDEGGDNYLVFPHHQIDDTALKSVIQQVASSATTLELRAGTAEDGADYENKLLLVAGGKIVAVSEEDNRGGLSNDTANARPHDIIYHFTGTDQAATPLGEIWMVWGVHQPDLSPDEFAAKLGNGVTLAGFTITSATRFAELESGDDLAAALQDAGVVTDGASVSVKFKGTENGQDIYTITADGQKIDAVGTVANGVLTLTAEETGADGTAVTRTLLTFTGNDPTSSATDYQTALANEFRTGITYSEPGSDSALTGTIDGGIQNPTSFGGKAAAVANTTVDFGQVNAWEDGAKITLGDTTYTVALGKDSVFRNAPNVIDLTDLETADPATAAQRLASAARDNETFIVGHDGTGKTTLQQRLSAKDSTDMTTREKIAGYLGVSRLDREKSNPQVGESLTLQIGDSPEDYDQLTVDIHDMHTAALGLSGISIATQESAASAIKAIKNAINQVSDVRGTLGATQNRLDHTINNLSVMAENIQDSESTIRDVDVAEEMMAYTKNNILIQSAQAMLAQANQVPQGVLQLMQ